MVFIEIVYTTSQQSLDATCKILSIMAVCLAHYWSSIPICTRSSHSSGQKWTCLGISFVGFQNKPQVPWGAFIFCQEGIWDFDPASVDLLQGGIRILRIMYPFMCSAKRTPLYFTYSLEGSDSHPRGACSHLLSTFWLSPQEALIPYKVLTPFSRRILTPISEAQLPSRNTLFPWGPDSLNFKVSDSPLEVPLLLSMS